MAKKRIMTEFVIFALLFGILSGALGFFGYNLMKPKASQTLASASEVRHTVIIDAGHGGVDGGATGVNGVLEKKLNLQLAEKLEKICRLMGYEVIMTRTEDVSLGEDAPKGHKKMTDLKRRLAFAEENPEAVFVSIHMNKFPEEYCRGVQVWYSPNSEKSRRLAGILKNAVDTKLGSENKRENKAANSSIYLLNRMKNTGILIECGFLSNNEECALLCDGTYQTRLAACIYYAIDEFFNNVG